MNLDKHANLCQLIHNSKNSELCDDKDTPIPSRKIMYQMLLELANKYKILEEKYEAMNKRMPAEIKKLNIITWLNENYTPQFIFDNLIDKIQLTDIIITELFNNDNFYDLLDKTFANCFHSDFPIIAFEQSPHKFYIFNNFGWEIIPKENILKFLNKVHMKICKYFYDWRKNNHRTDDTFAITCDKITIRLMGIVFKENESAFSKAKTILFKNIKQNLKASMEFDFEY
jgi:hypothetical protein